MTYVAYLSHPIGPADRIEDLTAHHDNLEHASAWLRFLINHTPWAIMCPWLAYLNAFGKSELYGPRALTDQVMMLERCDLLVQVGGWKSPHMAIEANHAKRRDMFVVDLTDLGLRPIQEEHIARQLRLRSAVLDKLTKRRVWMPPLDDTDVDALRAAQIALQADPFSDDAKNVIQRIIVAAMRK
jgi:hypothetical protein